MDSPVLQIVIFRDGSPVGTEVFLPGDYTVGSDDDCELVLTDPMVAPAHARLSFREGRIRLSDLGGGPAGVLVNGQPLSDGEVRSRDDVVVGPFVLKCRIMGSKRPAASAAPRSAGQVPVPPAAPPARAAQPARGPAALAPVPNPRQPSPGPLPRQASAIPLSRQPTPAPAAAVARGAALAAAQQPAAERPEAAERPTSKFEIASNLALPASVVSPAPPAADFDRGPPPSRAPLAPTGRPKAAQRLAPAPRPPLEAPHSHRMAKSGAGPEDSRQETPQSGVSAELRFQVAKPSLRVRVFWGRAMVGIHGFPHGQKVVAGALEGADVPLYGMPLPAGQFAFAWVKEGKWTVQVPPGLAAYRFEKTGWRPADGVAEGKREPTLITLEAGEVVRIGDARHSVEVRTDQVPGLPKKTLRESVDPQLGIPFGIVSVLAIAAMIAMPQFKPDPSDFTPKHLAPVRALLKPPEKKKPPEEKKKAEEKKEEKVAKTEKAPEAAKPKQPATVKQAIKAVEKTQVAVAAVESLLKATTKLAGGPKGYGDKGMGYKISPLIGKPPIAQAGIGFGAGMGGFGAETKGLGTMRGMGGGGGIGAFATGSVGKGKVAGAVISAPARKAEIRGQLDRELIAKVINEHMGEIRGCYERALLKEAGLAGKLVLEWTIEPTGIVSDIRVKNVTLRGPEVPNCIVGCIRSWAFPKPKGGNVVVSYPFLFNSVGF